MQRHILRNLLVCAMLLAPVVANAQNAPPVLAGSQGIGIEQWNGTVFQGVGPMNPLSIDQYPIRTVSANDHSGAITQGGSWQEVTGQNLNRMRFLFENYCTSTSQGIATSESIFFDLSLTMPVGAPTAAYPGAVELAACGSYDSSTAIVGTAPIWIYANTTGHRFMEKDW